MPAPDPASPLATAIRAAVRFNEIGTASPYQLSFAGKGTSGGSFGVFQNDCAVNMKARSALWRALNGAGVANADEIEAAVSRPCIKSPLSNIDLAATNQALATAAGRQLVDALDDVTFAGLLVDVGTSIDAAAAAGRTLELGAACAIACWANMTGAPLTLNGWLAGRAVSFKGRVPPPASTPTVVLEDVLNYLQVTDFYWSNPQNLPHLEAAVATGVAVAGAA